MSDLRLEKVRADVPSSCAASKRSVCAHTSGKPSALARREAASAPATPGRGSVAGDVR